MGLDPYHGDEAARWAATLRGVDYAFRVMMDSPVMQRWFAMEAAGKAQAAESSLMSAIARVRASSLLIATVDAAIIIVVPIAAWVGFWAMLGAAYAKAQAMVRSANFMSGFTQGYVACVLKWEWSHTTSRFGRWTPDFFPGDQEMGYISANAYNNGLRSGFAQAGSLTDQERKQVLGVLRSLSPNTKAHQWDRLDQISYVIELAGAARRNNVFRTT